MSEWDVVVVGEGIASRSVQHFLGNLKVLQISANESFRPCTLETTSHISQSGISKGVGPLGDLLLDAYEFTRELAIKEKWRGVYQGKKISFAPKELERLKAFERRYPQTIQFNNRLAHQEDFIAIDPHQFLKGRNAQVEAIVESYREYDKHIDVLTNKGVFKTRFLVLCLGVRQTYIDQQGQSVAGTYGRYQGDWGEESFCWSIGSSNLIYRSFSKELLIGGTTNKTQIELPMLENFYEQWLQFKELDFPNLPSFNSFKLSVGLRHKGQKRKPRLSREGNTWTLGQFYKNGFTLGPYLGHQAALEIFKAI